MASKVNPEIDNFIKITLKVAKRNLEYITSTDWSNITQSKIRDEEFNLQNTLTSKAIKNMKELYNMADKADELKAPTVKNALKVFKKFFTIFEERCVKYEEDDSWMYISTDISDKERSKAEERRTFEIEFGTKLTSSLIAYTNILNSIHGGDESGEVVVSLHSETKIPLAMIELSKERIPEVGIALEKLYEEKEEEEDGTD